MTILARWRTWCTTWYGHEEQDISLIAAKVGATTGSALCYNGENDSSIPWTRWISNRGGWSEGYLFKVSQKRRREIHQCCWYTYLHLEQWCMVLGSPSQHFINKAGDEEDMGGDNISGTSAMGDWIDNTV
jgi:hypothetical protein